VRKPYPAGNAHDNGNDLRTSTLARRRTLSGGARLSTILILTHVGSAVVLVLSGFVILQRTIGDAGRAPALEHASQALIVLVGLWLLWRAFRPHSRDHDRSVRHSPS
jgi:nickel/cobalt exporter